MNRLSFTLVAVLLLKSTAILAAEDPALARIFALGSENALFARLKDLSGPNATECGTVKLNQTTRLRLIVLARH